MTEHEKLMAIQKESQVCGEFLEWLQTTQRIQLMKMATVTEEEDCRCRGMFFSSKPRQDCDKCQGTGVYRYSFEGLVMEHRDITTLLAAFFEIDQTRLEEEKRAMLDELRSAG